MEETDGLTPDKGINYLAVLPSHLRLGLARQLLDIRLQEEDN